MSMSWSRRQKFVHGCEGRADMILSKWGEWTGDWGFQNVV